MFDKQKVPNQANQIQIQIMIERRNPLFALKEEHPVLRKPKHVSLVTARTSIWKTKQIPIERGDPLCPHSVVKQADNYRVRELVKSRTTLTDNLFNEIYDKTMPTTHLVRSPRR